MNRLAFLLTIITAAWMAAGCELPTTPGGAGGTGGAPASSSTTTSQIPDGGMQQGGAGGRAGGVGGSAAAGGGGVDSGPVCEDLDSDGHSTCAGDCDDADANVYPGQLAFFVTPRMNNSYDYDCDGLLTLQYPVHGKHNNDHPACTHVDGWTGGKVPDCGEQDWWMKGFLPEPGGPNGPHCSEVPPDEKKTQGCR